MTIHGPAQLPPGTWHVTGPGYDRTHTADEDHTVSIPAGMKAELIT